MQVCEIVNVFPTFSEDFLHWFFLKNAWQNREGKNTLILFWHLSSWPPLCCFQQDASNLCPRGCLAEVCISCIWLLGLFLPDQGGNRHQYFLQIKMLLPGHCLGSSEPWENFAIFFLVMLSVAVCTVISIHSSASDPCFEPLSVHFWLHSQAFSCISFKSFIAICQCFPCHCLRSCSKPLL